MSDAVNPDNSSWGPNDHPADQDVIRFCDGCDQPRHISWFKAGLRYCYACELLKKNYIDELSKLQAAIRAEEVKQLRALEKEGKVRTRTRTRARN